MDITIVMVLALIMAAILCLINIFKKPEGHLDVNIKISLAGIHFCPVCQKPLVRTTIGRTVCLYCGWGMRRSEVLDDHYVIG